MAYTETQPDLSDVQALIFTSETAVAAFARKSDRRDQPAWTVGPRTSEIAERLGFRVCSGPGTAEGLVRAIVNAGTTGPLLYICGHDTAFPVSETLTHAGIRTRAWVAYRQQDVAPTPDALAAAAGSGPVILPLFSALAAQRASAIFQHATAPLYTACISPAVGSAASRLPQTRRIIAASPDEAGMVAAVGILADDLHRS